MANVIVAKNIKYDNKHSWIQCSGFGWGVPCRALAGTPPPLLGIIFIVLGFFGVKS